MTIAKMRTIRVQDETRQKSASVTTTADTPWLEVSARAADLMELPVSDGGEPLVYHVYRADSGVSILADEQVGTTFREEEDHRVLQAPEMRPARA